MVTNKQPPEDGPGGTPHRRGPVDGDLQGHIGTQLRAVYETMISEPVPDRFLKLLEDLDRRSPEAE